MMLSAKGTVLDVSRQVNQLGLNVNKIKNGNFRTSESTKAEKFVLRKKGGNPEE